MTNAKAERINNNQNLRAEAAAIARETRTNLFMIKHDLQMNKQELASLRMEKIEKASKRLREIVDSYHAV